MKKAILSLSIEKVEDGVYKDSIECSGTEVEVLGMISKLRMFLNKVEHSVKFNMKDVEEA